MGELAVSNITVPTLLENLSKNQYLIPQFQREFVWDTSAIIGLITSVIDSHPIGMLTLWEQSDDSTLALEPISISDWDTETNSTQPKYFADPNLSSTRRYAVLDGRQRCTALAMAFAGFAPEKGNYKFAGKYFLDVTAEDEYERVKYFTKSQIEKKGLTTDSACISQGLFPFASSQEGESITYQWMRYLQALYNDQNYPRGEKPDQDELTRRDNVLKRAHKGINETKLAVYVVPEDYDLGEICDIFETLNTTGTKVSTVDLIHSWIYQESQKHLNEPVNIRDWMRELGEKSGAIGWSVVERRPELIAQMVTACYVGLNKKHDPRNFKKGKASPITSVKSPDLLNTPALHWRDIISNDTLFASFISDFQSCVADGFFPYSKCPYPITSAIYVALRWHKEFDDPAYHSDWSIKELNSLFKAFFWRNALSSRYDQGFLTKLGTDLAYLKQLLKVRSDFSSANEWAANVQPKLEAYMKDTLPSKSQLHEILTNGRPGGAMQLATRLPMLVGVKADFLTQADLTYPDGQVSEVHHIYPKKWCKNNQHLLSQIESESVSKDWIDSNANLMPLARETNNQWKDMHPATFLQSKQITFGSISAQLEPAFIDEELFEVLKSPDPDIFQFWNLRAKKMCDKFTELCDIKF